jgi:hypothetical protein
MFRPATRFGAFALLFTLACGGGDGPTNPGPNPPPPPPPPPPPGGSANFTATVNGQAWASAANLVNVTAAASGTYILSGTALQGTNPRSVTMTLMNIPGPGTYPLGTGAGVSGGTGIYAESAGGWGTPLSGDAGTITLTTLTAARIAGTFAFTGDAVSGGATGTRAVTNGAFDLAINSGTTTPVGEKNRMKLTATIGGQSYNASTMVTSGALGSIFVFGGSNTRYSITIGFSNLPGPGTYALGGGVLSSVQVSAPPGQPVTGPLCCWNGNFAGSTGSVTVTAITATRMTGTFTFILQPGGSGAATTPLTIANGTFDVGI